MERRRAYKTPSCSMADVARYSTHSVAKRSAHHASHARSRARTFADLVSARQDAAIVFQKHCDTPRSSTIEQHRNIRGYARSPHRGQVPSSASCSSLSQAISSALARSRKRFFSYKSAQPPRFSYRYWRRKRFGRSLTAFTHLAPIIFVARASSLSPSEPRSAVGSAKSSVSCYVAGIPRVSERASE